MFNIFSKKKKAIYGGVSEPINLARNWVHQAFFYMDTTEQASKVILEFFIAGLAYFFLRHTFNDNFSEFTYIVISIIFSHTINWFINGNWWACIIFAFPKLKNPGAVKTCIYLKKMQSRLKKNNSISGVLIYGSFSRGKWHNRSDIDMRILRKSGLKHAFLATFTIWHERTIALYLKQPLDVFLADNTEFLNKIRKDEYPVFLKKQGYDLIKLYKQGNEINISESCIQQMQLQSVSSDQE